MHIYVRGETRFNIFKKQGKIMKMIKQTCIVFSVGLILGILLFGSVTGYGQEAGSKISVPEGVYIKLTREFYQALRDEGDRGTRLYSNDPSVEYLKQISISTRFIVETNLQILKQQERIIQLLQSLQGDKKK